MASMLALRTLAPTGFRELVLATGIVLGAQFDEEDGVEYARFIGVLAETLLGVPPMPAPLQHPASYTPDWLPPSIAHMPDGVLKKLCR